MKVLRKRGTKRDDEGEILVWTLYDFPRSARFDMVITPPPLPRTARETSFAVCSLPYKRLARQHAVLRASRKRRSTPGRITVDALCPGSVGMRGTMVLPTTSIAR